MNVRRCAILSAALVVFLPLGCVVYSMASLAIGEVAQPVIAPSSPSPFVVVVIDHFHVEGFVEVAFLGACLVVPVRRWIVWLVATLGIPLIPHLLLEAINGFPSLPGRSFARDFALWSVESLGAGILSCALWEATILLLRLAAGTRRPQGGPPNIELQRTKPAQAMELRR